MKQGHCFKVHTRVRSNILATLIIGTIPPPILYYYYCCCNYYYYYYKHDLPQCYSNIATNRGTIQNISLKDETPKSNTVSQLHFITIFSRLQRWSQGSLSLCLWSRDGTPSSLSLMSVLYLWTKHITCE